MKVNICLIMTLFLFISCNKKGETDIVVYSISSFVGDEHFAVTKIDTGYGASYVELKSFYIARNNRALSFFDKEFNKQFDIKMDTGYEDNYYLDPYENMYTINDVDTGFRKILKRTASSNYSEEEVVPFVRYYLNDLLKSDIHQQKINAITKVTTTTTLNERLEALEAYKNRCVIDFFEETLELKNLTGYMSTSDTNLVFIFFNDNRSLLIDFGVDIKKLLQEVYSIKDIRNTDLNELSFEDTKRESKFLTDFKGETTGYRTAGVNHFSFDTKPPYGYNFYNLIDKGDTTVIYSYPNAIYVLNEDRKVLFNQGNMYRLERCSK